ncbi:hypothetical protein FHL15_004379 [Xylaria flabelliformis]|uniref:Uncharacterized protein n=1 Tax=Xylaria flabelliformis TaxID=2512241 RepID=A0A553I327_9PEZI|nr:hypothetical protein FHL15_004379 [Xylaria flabelliformis]
MQYIGLEKSGVLESRHRGEHTPRGGHTSSCIVVRIIVCVVEVASRYLGGHTGETGNRLRIPAVPLDGKRPAASAGDAAMAPEESVKRARYRRLAKRRRRCDALTGNGLSRDDDPLLQSGLMDIMLGNIVACT